MSPTDKNGTSEKIDQSIADTIASLVKNGELPCAVAFDIASKLSITPQEVGNYADHLKIRLVKCQMGLFGYQPEKKIVQSAPSIPPDLETAINNALSDGKLTCRGAWDLAALLKMPKMTISNACEAMKVKITTCQIGAF
jgi:hypothetical protein